jgi:UDP-2-acetamido-3-amino-2,3-dideoxy-glucuronate N-acetyltransferase
VIAPDAFVHETAVLDPGCTIGPAAKIWHFCHIRTGAAIGRDVSLARDVYVDVDVPIGECTRVQNGVSIYRGVTIGRYCFIGPHAIFTNDVVPRVGVRSWRVVPTTIEDGASLGAGTIVRCGVRIGAFALVGTGSVVTRDVPAFHLVHGLPARPRQRICACGQTQSPLRWPLGGVLDCCREHLEPEVLAVAIAEQQRVLRAAA